MKPNLDMDVLTDERAWLEHLARRMVRDRDEADDVVQDSYVAAIQSPPPADRPTRGWLGRVATNVVRARYRSGSRRTRREQAADVPSPPPGSFELLHKKQAAALLSRALDELAEPYRTAVRLRFYAEQSVAQIARAQGVPVGTAGWRVSEGVKRLRSQLDRDAGGDARPWLMALCPGLAFSETPAAGPPAATPGGTIMTKLAISIVLAFACATALVVYQRHSAADDRGSSASVESAEHERLDANALETIPLEQTPSPAAGASGSAGHASDDSLAAGADVRRAAAAHPPHSLHDAAASPYQLTFSVVDQPEVHVPTDMLRDIPESGTVLRECLKEYVDRTEVKPDRADATVRVTLQQDADLGVVVADSRYQTDVSVADSELRQCMEAGAHAIRLEESIGSPGDRLVVDVGIRYDRSMLSDSKQASVMACVTSLFVRNPGIDLDGRVDDEEFARCMNDALGLAMPHIPEDMPAEQAAALEACMQRTSSPDTDPMQTAGDLAACAAEAGLTVSSDSSKASARIFIKKH